MKKILYSVFALAIAAFTFTSCEDVPAPYDDPNDNPSDQPIVIEPSGDGTAASPYNVARILELAGTLESGEDLPSKVYITGVVVGIEENYNSLGPSGTPYGNATFTIADNEDSNTTFLVYRANYFDNKKWQECQDILEFGDSVVVYGTVTNYNGTIETDQNNAYLVYLNGQTGEGGGGDEPEEPITGENLLENGDFETWSSTSQPDNWKSTTTASSATLAQSTDAHGGSYSVLVGGSTSQNKRLAYKEITLKAGTYQMAFYAKAVDTEGTVCPGYVPVTDGKVGQYEYKDNGYVDLSSTEWTQVTNTFTLDATTTVNLVVMNAKSPGMDVLVDDFTLTTNDGGLTDEQPEEPTVTTATYALTTNVASGSKFVFAAQTGGNNYVVATPVEETYNYGWLYTEDVTMQDNAVTTSEDNEFTITAVGGGYTIQDNYGRYYYMAGTYDSFNVSTDMPSSGGVWTITFNDDNTVNVTNVEMGKTLQYSADHSSFGAYTDSRGTLPSLFVKQ